MKTQNKYVLNIGLSKADMSTPLNYNSVKQIIISTLLDKGILGFNLKEQIGYWEGQAENSLEVSFINTSSLNEKEIIRVTHELTEALEQDCILLEKINEEYDFI